MQAQKPVQQAVFNEGLWLRTLEDAKRIEGIPPQFGAERERRAWDMVRQMGEVSSPSFKTLPDKEQIARRLMAQYLINIALESRGNEAQLNDAAAESGKLLTELDINVSAKESAIEKIKEALSRHLQLGVGKRITELRTATWAASDAETAARKAEQAAKQVEEARLAKIKEAQMRVIKDYMKEADRAGVNGDKLHVVAGRRIQTDMDKYAIHAELYNRQLDAIDALRGPAAACWNANPALRALQIPRPVATWEKYMSGGTRKGARSKKLKSRRTYRA